jgi:hypothetical protein
MTTIIIRRHGLIRAVVTVRALECDMTMARRFASPGFRLASALLLALTLIAAGASGPGGGSTVAAQTPDPCALLQVDEIQPLAVKASVAEGVSKSMPAAGYAACRYTWGTGADRFILDVVVNETSLVYPGMSPDLVKLRIQASPRPETSDAALADIGEAAVFRVDSPVYATTTALVKGRLLHLQLDGLYAIDKKDQLIALLKSAASRL